MRARGDARYGTGGEGIGIRRGSDDSRERTCGIGERENSTLKRLNISVETCKRGLLGGQRGLLALHQLQLGGLIRHRRSDKAADVNAGTESTAATGGFGT